MNTLLEVYRNPVANPVANPVDCFTQPPFLPNPPLWRDQNTKNYTSHSSPIRCTKIESGKVVVAIFLPFVSVSACKQEGGNVNDFCISMPGSNLQLSE